jgi:hypothetical protein
LGAVQLCLFSAPRLSLLKRALRLR